MSPNMPPDRKPETARPKAAEPKTAALHQITMSFSPEEDRILLRVSTTDGSEYQLWLTRRFVRVLWGALVQTLERDPELQKTVLPEVRDAIMGMRHQEALASSDFEKPHQAGKRNLTSNTGPLIVTGGTVTPLKNGTTRLTFTTTDGTGINFLLNENLLHATCHLIISTTQKADWDLDLTVGDPMVIAADKSVIH